MRVQCRDRKIIVVMRPMRNIIFTILGILFPIFVSAQTLSAEVAELVSDYHQFVRQRLGVTGDFGRDTISRVIESNPYWKLVRVYDSRREYRYFMGQRLDSMRELYVKFQADKVEYGYQFYKIPIGYLEHVYPFFQKKEFDFSEYYIFYCSDDKILIHDVSTPFNVAERYYRIYELQPISQREMQKWEKRYKTDLREQRRWQRKIARIERQKAKMPPQPIRVYGFSVLSDDEWKTIIQEQCFNDKKTGK